MSTAPIPNLNRVALPQGTVSYRVAGPSNSTLPPVVFVHGLLVDGLLWTGVADALANSGIRSYAPDWPLGSHREPMNADADLSPRGVARIVIDFLTALDLVDVTLVGNDTGGAVCQFLVDTDPDRIGRLVLTNCDAFDTFPPAPFVPLVKAGRSAKLLKPMLASMRPKFLRHGPLGFGLLFNNEPDAGITRGWIEPCASDKAIRRDTAKVLRGIKRKDLLDVSTRLSGFTKPVHLVWGDADKHFKIGFGERLAAVFPNARLTPVVGGRTFIPMEQPDQVAAVIAAAAAVTT
jgi:pimeloyl-ACP methyl ester carboxylesterase